MNNRTLTDEQRRDIVRYRMENAQKIDSRIVLEIKRLLMENEKTISEIAYSLGFYELSYFSRSFRRMEGVSPAEFRERVTFSDKSQ